jgi:hypothetical protein
MKRSIGVSTVIAICIIAGMSFLPAKDKLDGKTLYFEYCRPCHTEDSDDGDYSPMSLIQDQWNEFFDERLASTHDAVTDPNHDNKPVLEVLTPELLKAIKKFTVDHAADSEQPMSCDSGS